MHDPGAPDPEAVRLVKGLNDLMHGESAVAVLVLLGSKAIPPLRQFLLEGRPSTVYHPRRWAVSALGELGAADVLVEYLKSRRPISDPQVRFGEDAVRDAAIRELAAQANENVVRFLLDFSKSEMLPSLAEAFGKLQCVEAPPSSTGRWKTISAAPPPKMRSGSWAGGAAALGDVGRDGFPVD